VSVDVLQQLDGRFAEAFAGDSPDGVHINLVVGRRGGATAAAASAALTAPAPGHVPFLACLRPDNAVQPPTVVVNKTTVDSDLRGRLTWGAAQLGIAQGVLDCVADSTIPQGAASDLVLLVALWLDTAATDETTVRRNAREGIRTAVGRAVSPGDGRLETLVADRENAANGFYGGS
jgi:5,6,7,8-tetrahydromethanopterin hydro-lyase